MRDLFGATTLASDDVPGEADDTANNAFPFRQPTADRDGRRRATWRARPNRLAQALAAKLTSRPPQRLHGARRVAEAACATQFINTFGPKAYRRPPNAKEVANLTSAL